MPVNLPVPLTSNVKEVLVLPIPTLVPLSYIMLLPKAVPVALRI
jgi:hypothetical protein